MLLLTTENAKSIQLSNISLPHNNECEFGQSKYFSFFLYNYSFVFLDEKKSLRKYVISGWKSEQTRGFFTFEIGEMADYNSRSQFNQLVLTILKLLRSEVAIDIEGL